MDPDAARIKIAGGQSAAFSDALVIHDGDLRDVFASAGKTTQQNEQPSGEFEELRRHPSIVIQLSSTRESVSRCSMVPVSVVDVKLVDQ